MKKLALINFALVALMALLVVNGCIFNSLDETDEPADELAAIDQSFGGFTAADEAAAFGDAILVEEYADDVSETDLLESDPTLEADLNNPAIDVYFLRIAWGLLEGDSTATEVIEWNGKAEINKGALVASKRIRFERNDYIVRPRSSEKMVEWVSFTQPHFDGIFLTIINNDTTNLPGEFKLTVGAFSRTFSFAELDSLDLLEPVGANGHEISIISRQKSVVPFAGGFLEGRWVRKDSVGGAFFGKWINRQGTRVGHLRGIWGVNRLGQQVLYGKWIDLNGKFQGLLSGTWGHDENSTTGWMEGRWVNRSLTTAGAFTAQWKQAESATNRGFFHGSWFRKL
jgi:hypothetical protein